MRMMTTKCKKCGGPIEYIPIPGYESLFPSICKECSVGGDSPVDQQIKAVHEERWTQLCPTAFRTLEEGGITDPARLPVVDWPEGGREKPGLLIVGPSGKCKTRLAWRALRTEFDANKRIIDYTPREFQDDYLGHVQSFKTYEFTTKLYKADVLFIDDLGKASWSQTTLEAFYDIVDHRAKWLRPIFITTNFTGSGLADQLKLDAAIMEPLLRRLRDNCRVIKFE